MVILPFLSPGQDRAEDPRSPNRFELGRQCRQRWALDLPGSERLAQKSEEDGIEVEEEKETLVSQDRGLRHRSCRKERRLQPRRETSA